MRLEPSRNRLCGESVNFGCDVSPVCGSLYNREERSAAPAVQFVFALKGGHPIAAEIEQHLIACCVAELLAERQNAIRDEKRCKGAASGFRSSLQR